MSELNGVLLAIELATIRRDEAAKHAVKMGRSLEFSQTQMTQLQDYADDTDARWVGAATQAVSRELIRHHYQFMGRLQQAIALQSDAVHQVGEQVDKAKQTLLQAELRLAGLNMILKTRQGVQLRKRNRMDQRHTDEFAALLHGRTRAQSLSGETT